MPGVSRCSDCGGPLVPGPLGVRERTADESVLDFAERAADPDDPPDTLIIRCPGLEAEHWARALTLEGITCLLECEGVRSPRTPDREPSEPLAVTLPVSLYVPARAVERAREILRSLESEDLIGSDWATSGEPGDAIPTDGVTEVAPEDPASLRATTPRPEGTSLRLAIFLVVAGLFLLFVLGR